MPVEMPLLHRRTMLRAIPSLLPLVASTARAADTLRVGMVPDAGATQVSVLQKAPLRDFLAARTGRPVTLVIPTSYNATVEGLGNASLDIAYLGGLTYVKAHDRYGVLPLVQRGVDRHFHALLIAHAGSGIRTVADLKGKSFAFGDINSTSGHLFPYLALKQAGIDVRADLRSVRYTGSHAATAQAVAAGIVDAGGVDETVFRTMVADGKIPAGAAYVFATSPAFADYVWVARPGLPPATREAVVQAFLGLRHKAAGGANGGADDAVLRILRADGYVRADDAEYATVRAVARELGLL